MGACRPLQMSPFCYVPEDLPHQRFLYRPQGPHIRPASMITIIKCNNSVNESITIENFFPQLLKTLEHQLAVESNSHVALVKSTSDANGLQWAFQGSLDSRRKQMLIDYG